jgi:hypothetical protein
MWKYLFKNIVPEVFKKLCFVQGKLQLNSNQGLWAVMPCSVILGYQCFRGPCCLHLQGGGSMNLWNASILLQHYMMSQLRRHGLKYSLLWKLQISCFHCLLGHPISLAPWVYNSPTFILHIFLIFLYVVISFTIYCIADINFLIYFSASFFICLSI